ncbi:ComEC/Rec2 family competence protein [Candidatus Dojkabacteria bacterium]|nr:ComEC/Rec2 family competence protein [Candidatus Dojkabacteria bacterium]
MLGSILKRTKYLFLLFSRLPIFSFSLFYILGTIYANSFSFVTIWYLLLFLPFLFFLRKIPLAFTVLLAISAVFLGAIRGNGAEIEYQSSWIKSLWNEEVEIKGTIVREPVLKGSKYQYVVKPDLKNKKTIFDFSGDESGYILVELSKFVNYSYGDYLSIYGTVVEPPEFEDFSYKEYLKTQKVYAIVEDARVKLNGRKGNLLFRKLYDLKHYLVQNIRSEIPEPHASLLLGILLGVKSGMPKSFSQDLSNTGTTHIIAVSGYNVTVVLASLVPLQFFLGRKKIFWLSLIVLFIFLAVVGFDNSPAVRSGTMGFVYLIAKYSGRRGDIKTILTFVAAILIYINPFIINSLSFQLSFASTTGVIVLTAGMTHISKRNIGLISTEFAPTISALVATAPITILNFGKISIVSLIVNVLVLPVIPLLMGLGALLSLFSIVPNLIFRLLGFLIFQLLDYVIKIICWFGNLNFAIIGVPKSNYISLIVYSLILLFFFETNYKKYITRYE